MIDLVWIKLIWFYEEAVEAGGSGVGGAVGGAGGAGGGRVVGESALADGAGSVAEAASGVDGDDRAEWGRPFLIHFWFFVYRLLLILIWFYLNFSTVREAERNKGKVSVSEVGKF